MRKERRHINCSWWHEYDDHLRVLLTYAVLHLVKITLFQNYMSDVPVGFVTPSLIWGSVFLYIICILLYRRRLAVARYQMICLVLVLPIIYNALLLSVFIHSFIRFANIKIKHNLNLMSKYYSFFTVHKQLLFMFRFVPFFTGMEFFIRFEEVLPFFFFFYLLFFFFYFFVFLM